MATPAEGPGEHHREDGHGKEGIEDGPGKSENRSLIAKLDVPDHELAEQLSIPKEGQERAGGTVVRQIDSRLRREGVSSHRATEEQCSLQ